MAYVPVRRPVRPPRPQGNALWRNWMAPGICLGLGTTLLGLVILSLEVARAFIGVENRGCLNDTLPKQYRFYQNHLWSHTLSDVNPDNLPAAYTHFIWPWTRPAILFGLTIIATGIVGIISGCRRSYSSIIAFLVMSMLSAFLLSYLIAYYSVVVHFYNYRNVCAHLNLNESRSGNEFKHFLRISRALLAFAVLAVPWVLLSLLLSCVATAAYSRKGQFRSGPVGPRVGYPPIGYPPGYGPPRFIR